MLAISSSSPLITFINLNLDRNSCRSTGSGTWILCASPERLRDVWERNHLLLGGRERKMPKRTCYSGMQRAWLTVYGIIWVCHSPFECTELQNSPTESKHFFLIPSFKILFPIIPPLCPCRRLWQRWCRPLQPHGGP